MSKIHALLFYSFAVLSSAAICLAQKPYDTNAVIITRVLEKDLFDLNSVPYMQPLVNSINSTSNARFYNQAKVPKKVSKAYFRFGIHTMVGFVRDDQTTYRPQLPGSKDPIDYPKYVQGHLDLGSGKFVVDRLDTVGLSVALVKRLFQKALDSNKVIMPYEASTVFGSKDTTIIIDREYLVQLLHNDPEFSGIYQILNTASPSTTQRIDSAIIKMPNYFTLLPGQNIKTVFAAIPQLEIGSYYGTEMMLRFIPPLQWDKSIGKFAFWGIALKHSISQYLDDPSFEMAVQLGYQGTHLNNTVGVTNAELVSDATFWNLNVHVSKEFKGICELFSGVNYESVDINSSYSYTLPQEMQIGLGLLVPDPPNGAHRDSTHPGDDVIQTSISHLSAANFKWTIGALKQIGPVALFVDYSISRFNIFSGGIEYRF